MKKLLLISINYIFLTLVYAFLSDKIKWGIFHYQHNDRGLIYQYFDPKADFISGLLFSILTYLLYFVWIKIIKRKNALKASLVFAILNFVILSFVLALFSFGISNYQLYFLITSPIFVIGLLLPFSEWLFAKMIKYKFKGL